MEWTSIEQIKSTLRLEAAASDIHQIDNELRKRRIELHPDTSGGEFRDHNHEALYHLFDSAQTYVTKLRQSGSDNFPVAQTKDLVSQPSGLPPIVASDAPSRDDCLKQGQLESNARLHLAQVISGVFASLCGILLMIVELSPTNPFFSAILQDTWVGMFLIVGLLVSAICFVGFRIIEQLKQRYAKYLMTIRGREEIFERVGIFRGIVVRPDVLLFRKSSR